MSIFGVEVEELVSRVRDERVKGLEYDVQLLREESERLTYQIAHLTARNEELRFALSCLKDYK